MFGFSDGLHAALPSPASCARAAARATRRRGSLPGMRSRELARQQALDQRAPARAPPPNSVGDRQRAPQRPALRGLGRPCGRPWRRPAAARCRPAVPYCTPDGHVVSQLRHVRQRSRCSCVFAVTARAFEHLLDEVDAPARPVELVAEELVGRARRRAEAAVHARAQDRVGLAAVARVAVLGSEVGLHQNPATSGRD